MKGFSRSIKYFTVLALRLAGVLVLLLAMLFVLRLLLNRPFSGATSTWPFFILFLCAILVVACSLGLYIWMPSHIISFSCTRRNLFWGCMWLYTLMTIVICAALELFVLFLSDWEGGLFLRYVPYSIGLLTASAGIGTLLGGILIYFGKGALVLMTVLSAVLSAAAGFCFSFFSFSDFNFGTGNAYIVLLAGVLIFIGGAAVNYVFLRRASVR